MSDTNIKNILLKSSFKRTTKKPLEADTIFTSLTAATEWVRSDDTNAYVSQIIAVVNEEGVVTHYKVEGDDNNKKLSELTPEIVAEDVDLSNYYTKDETYSKEDTDGLIASAGKVKDVKVNGETVLSGDTANVTLKSDITSVGKEIKVEGGPFADELKAAGITAITSNMTVYEVFEKMFSNETYPSVGYENANVIAKIDAPTIKGTETNNSTIEVGTVFTLSAITSEESEVSTKTNNQVTGLTYGYATELNGTITKLSGGILQKNTTTTAGTGYIMQIEVNSGFTNTTTLSASGETSATINSTILGAVKEGTNKLTLSVTGAPINYSCDAIDPIYIASNFGNTSDSHKTNSVEPVNSVSNTPTASTTFTVYGKYKYFIGCYGDETFDKKVYTAESIRDTDKRGEGFMNGTTISTKITVPAGTKGMYIAIPKGVDDEGEYLVVKQVNTNAYVNKEMAENKRTITLACGGSHTKDYVIFSWSFPGGTSAEEPFEITRF